MGLYEKIRPQLIVAHPDQLDLRLRKKLRVKMDSAGLALILQRAVRYSLASDFIVQVLVAALRDKCNEERVDVQAVLAAASAVIEDDEKSSTKKTQKFVERNT